MKLQLQQQHWPQLTPAERADFGKQVQLEHKKLKVAFPEPVSAGKNSHYDCFTDALCHVTKG